MVRRRRRQSVRRRRKTSNKPNILNFEIESHIAREIWAVVYMSLAALTWLSLGGRIGVVGDLWVSLLKPVFGVGLSAMPFVMMFMGISTFLSKKIKWGLARFTGLFFLAVSVLGTIHAGTPLDQMLEVAQSGQGGGYIGFVSSFIFMSAFGSVGAYVLFVASFLIGILLTVQVSLGDILKFFTPSPKKVKKTFDAITPEFNIIDADDFNEPLRIVQPKFLEDEEDSMTIKEVSPNEVEAKLAKIKTVEEDDVEVEMPEEDVSEWEYPALDLLFDSKEGFTLNQADLKKKAELIKSKLEQFGINVNMHEVHVGPTVIQYTLKPSEGVKLSKITSLKNDLALALAAPAVRIEAPIPGKSLVGIEIPNDSRSHVFMREMMETEEYKKTDSGLKLALGRDVSGNSIVADLSKMPHLLIAGATGSGKSVGLNSFLISLIYNNSPKELKFIMIDPKQVELSTYNGMPHLLTPVIVEPEKAATALRWAVAEMNRRYKVCAEAGHRNIADYNKDKKTAEKMPKIVIVIDELADLMMSAQKEVEASICRIAQMARAVGMHLIVATQRPSVDVITGLIKANIPTRIAFTVASSIDSRTILDTIGAEDLLGQGDMLFLSGSMAKPMRIQGIYISSKEIENVTNKLKLTREPNYRDDITAKETAKQRVPGVPDMPDGGQSDEDLMSAAIECLKKNRKSASTSSLQRYLRIGYSRAARIIDMLEEAGYIGPSQGSKPREVYLPDED
ncbi:DNA translocase FtsK 4TM domain-containing protein [Candidatus Peregrinibacteria bacterium]|nr:DNA translocase FtsK 4TM domain-containing protein [Candidatus Peregrinibacteria bacterium]